MTWFKKTCRNCGHQGKDVMCEWTYADAWWICRDRLACLTRMSANLPGGYR